MKPTFSKEEYIVIIKKYLAEKMKNRDVLEFRNLSDEKFPQVFFQKRVDKYLLTDSMLGVCFIKDDDKLITLDSTIEVMQELLSNGYKIQNIDKELISNGLMRGKNNAN
ncbi:hypothetical protein [Cetobacterium sp.]|uniref:hypothetical protein n=1 Tax=Cetobacterium sp. TaxID=2071632 RepID=UPI003F351416